MAQLVLRGDTRAIGKLISQVENDPEQAVPDLKELYPYTGEAHVVGITGPPGGGKSTLTDRLAKLWRKRDYQVGIVAVDPNSPFSGGALLGDRVRMQDLATDPGVFIRSMGTRGHLGGLARTTHNVIRVLDASGKDIILVETVGVGQSEVDIVRTADTVVVGLVPGMGDDIQTIKAGVLEIADLFVINKADHPDVKRLQMELEMLVDWNQEEASSWRPPVLTTVATLGQGLEALRDAIAEHREYLEQSGELLRRRKQRYEAELQSIVEDHWRAHFHRYWQQDGSWEQVLQQLLDKEKDPFTAARELLAPFLELEKGG